MCIILYYYSYNKLLCLLKRKIRVINLSIIRSSYYQQNKDKILAKRRQQYKDSAKDIRATNKLAYNKNPARQRALASRL